jgi:hypothetical protein
MEPSIRVGDSDPAAVAELVSSTVAKALESSGNGIIEADNETIDLHLTLTKENRLSSRAF